MHPVCKGEAERPGSYGSNHYAQGSAKAGDGPVEMLQMFKLVNSAIKAHIPDDQPV